MGAVVGIILMLPAIFSFAIDRLTQSKNQGTVTSKTVDFKIKPNKKRDLIFTVYCVIINVLIFLILGSVIFASLIKLWLYNTSLTLAHYFVDSPATGGISSYLNSVTIAFLTAIFGDCGLFLCKRNGNNFGGCISVPRRL